MVLWDCLIDVGNDIDRWHFVERYELLPSTIWYLWDYHRSNQTEGIFLEFMREEIEKGEEYCRMLVDVLPNGIRGEFNLAHWGAEVGEMFSKVHKSIAALRIRLELVESGVAKRFPEVLYPQDQDV
jgi:hypothetical protein